VLTVKLACAWSSESEGASRTVDGADSLIIVRDNDSDSSFVDVNSGCAPGMDVVEDVLISLPSVSSLEARLVDPWPFVSSLVAFRFVLIFFPVFSTLFLAISTRCGSTVHTTTQFKITHAEESSLQPIPVAL
jgi:hypothetical protein